MGVVVVSGRSDEAINWRDCVQFLAEQYAAGLSEREAGMRWQNRRVSWAGTIDEVKLDSEHAPGLRVQLEPLELEP
jgi:hypothetical protein